MTKGKGKIFSRRDKILFKRQGILLADAKDQLASFKQGFSGVKLVRPCTVGDGILKLTADEQLRFEKKFETEASNKKILKFVPASGAASRMFHFLEAEDPLLDALRAKFIKNLDQFPFCAQLIHILKKQGYSLQNLIRKKNFRAIYSALLNSDGLGYRDLPKGMIPFHRKGHVSRTAFEEQLSEGILFVNGKKNTYLHFTLPESARMLSRAHLKKAASKTKKAKFCLSDSVQNSATNCLAIEKNGKPVRNSGGELMLRPAGHGALLQNLNAIKADLIYVKNIDNILPHEKRTEADRWKKIMGGVFFYFQKRIFFAQKILTKRKILPGDLLFALKVAHELGWNTRSALRGQARENLASFLNRPLRVCGMVPNAGEPGGGPFWVQDEKKNASLQIIEATEVHFRNKKQARIWRSSTHFNPVDFVCGVYDFRGGKYNLEKFKNKKRGMISHKTYEGREIKAMELPGLWNGGMAEWLTVFIEMPATVFAPVKTVLDLLRDEHQI